MKTNLLRDVLVNTHAKSGASVDYGKGVVVAVVSTLMANGSSFEAACQTVKECLPPDFRRECIPETWKI
jgi:hypothetical protein